MKAPESNPLFVGGRVVNLKEVDSTNSYALKLIRDNEVPEGTVIIAQNQFEGRGQRGANWMSAPGMNFTGSIILKPSFVDVADQFDLNRVISLAVAKVLSEDLGIGNVAVKWPNDILVNGKKICGILIENTLNGNRLTHAVIGIGLNVNQAVFDSELNKATSIFREKDSFIHVDTISKMLYSRIESGYLQLRSGHSEKIREDYMKDLYRRNLQTRFTDFRTVFNASIETISRDGKLVLRKDSGEQATFSFKEIAMLD